MIKKVIPSLTLLTAVSFNSVNAMERQDHIGPYHGRIDPLQKESDEMDCTKKYSIEDIKEKIMDSSWYKKYAKTDGKINFSSLPGDAVRSDGSFRIDYEGNGATGPKFRFQTKDVTFASVRIDPSIEWLYPSQLAKAIYFSATTGKKIVVN
jgi:hypothetical protein